MKPLRSKALAFEMAAILRRMTGDNAVVFGHVTQQGHEWFQVVRTDPSGKEYQS